MSLISLSIFFLFLLHNDPYDYIYVGGSLEHLDVEYTNMYVINYQLGVLIKVFYQLGWSSNQSVGVTTMSPLFIILSLSCDLHSPLGFLIVLSFSHFPILSS
jgi:hypothetical protein